MYNLLYGKCTVFSMVTGKQNIIFYIVLYTIISISSFTIPLNGTKFFKAIKILQHFF